MSVSLIIGGLYQAREWMSTFKLLHFGNLRLQDLLQDHPYIAQHDSNGFLLDFFWIM